MYDAYARRVYGVCAAILRDDDEASDAMHDTFVLAMQRIGQLRDPERLRPWLFAIARHVCFRRLAQRKRAQVTADVDLSLAEAVDAASSDAIGEDEAAALVWAAAQGLNERDRTVLALQLQEGLDGAELAAALGVRHANPYSLVHRARAQLDRALGALIIARVGRDDCQTLSELLGDWDGGLTPLVRKRLARHLDGCAACQQTNRRARRLSALSSLALVAPTPAEAMTASHLLDIANRTPIDAERWLPDGFPPYLDKAPKRRRLVLVAVAVGVIGALLTVTALASGAGHTHAPTVAIAPVASQTPSATTVPSRPRASTVTTIKTQTATTTAGASTPTTANGVPVSVPLRGVEPPPPGPPVTKASPTTVKLAPPTTGAPASTTTTSSETVFTF
jgi:RNA polymerase sigma factor (sigma-70 family)